MDSSSGAKKDYPRRLFQKGRTPKQFRSANHNAHLWSLGRVKEELGEDVWANLHDSPLGVIMKFAEIDFVFCSKLIHDALTNRLVTKTTRELWTVLEDRPIRFSLHEFSAITSLNCDPITDETQMDIDHATFWKEMGISTLTGPCLNELMKMLPRCRLWSFEQRRMVAWLVILSVVIYGISPATRVPLETAKLVLDAECFEKYPWGRVAFTSLLAGISKIDFDETKSYNIRGFVPVLQIWLYESIPLIGDLYGNRLMGGELPLLSWVGSRARMEWHKIMPKEKEAHGKLRVRHLIVKPTEDIYPKWTPDEGVDKQLDNMIQDILNDRLDETFWDADSVEATTKKKRRKKKVLEDEDGGDQNDAKKRKNSEEVLNARKKAPHVSES